MQLFEKVYEKGGEKIGSRITGIVDKVKGLGDIFDIRSLF